MMINIMELKQNLLSSLFFKGYRIPIVTQYNEVLKALETVYKKIMLTETKHNN